MKNYKNYLKLLPHKWQVVCLPLGIALYVTTIIYAIYHARIAPYLQGDVTQWMLNGIQTNEWMCIPLGLLLMVCCLSEEKVEDEYIASVRYRALAVSVFTFFIASAIMGTYGNSIRIANFFYNALQYDPHAFAERMMGIHNSIAHRIVSWTIGSFASVNNMQIFYIVLLKVMVRRGSGNIYGSFLFPYKCRKTGWWILLSSIFLIIVISAIWIRNEMESKKVLEILLGVSILMNYAALVMICLSKEEQEDEFIRQVRGRLVAIFALYFIIALYVEGRYDSYYKMWALNHNGIITTSGKTFIWVCLMGLSRFPIVALAYSIVLKKVLANNLKESSNEE